MSGQATRSPIPMVGTGGFPCIGGPITSVANVPLVGNLNPAGLEITNVTVDITHTFDADLDITLISPMGTTLDLSSDNGGAGDNYTNTVFDDNAGSSIVSGSAPFTGSYIPEGGDFETAFLNEPVNGNWTLSICDDAGGDVGTLNSWSITFGPYAPPPMLTTVCGAGNPQPIPVSGTGGFPCIGGPVTSVANVALTGNLNPMDLEIREVEVNITHTFDADLDITLISPMGTMLDLSSDNGGAGDNYTNTIFDDDAAFDITGGTAPFTGTFRPEGGTFGATFLNESVTGNWTLSICDDAGGDVGTLDSWCISFGPYEPPTLETTLCGSGNPQPIPAIGTGGFPCIDGPVTSPINVALGGNVGQPGGQVINEVLVDITHTFDADLDITLISPMGTMLDLSSDNGGAGDNYSNTMFVDGAPSITTGSAPFSGMFEPEAGPMNVAFANEPVDGNWVLSICDDAGGDIGTLVNWCMTFEQFDCTITCPNDTVVDADPGMCGAMITLADAKVGGASCLDVPGVGPFANDFNGQMNASGFYPVGTTTVTYWTNSTSGIVECSFTVTVNDLMPSEPPNCRDINVSLDHDGAANFTLGEIVTGGACSNFDVEITTLDGGLRIYSASDLVRASLISFDACHLIDRPLKVSVRGLGGSCWSVLTLKQGNRPSIQGSTATVYCFDDLAHGPVLQEAPLALVPCEEAREADYVTDWIFPYPCEPGVQDTVKMILREWEAFGKDGTRGVGFDTIYVLQLGQIDDDHIYCVERDTVYCGDTTGVLGPYITYENIDGTCDSMYLITISDLDDDGMLEFTANEFETKCGLNVHVDAWKFEGDCFNQYKVVVELKQNCYGPPDVRCNVPVRAGTLPNVARMISPGYWQCEFWVVDLDTLPPDLYCKGEELFIDPFDIKYWDVQSAPLPLPEAAESIDDPTNSIDLSNLPHQLIINSVHEPIAMAENKEIAGFGIFEYNQSASMSYTAMESSNFDFGWVFELGTANGMSAARLDGDETLKAALQLPGYAEVGIYFSINGEPYRIVEGESIKLISGSTDPESANSLSLVQVSADQRGRLSIPLEAGDELLIRAVWSSFGNSRFILFGPTVVYTSTHECAAHTYIPPVYAADDWSGLKQVKAMVEGVGTYLLSYDDADSCWVSHEQIKLPKRDNPYKVIYEAVDTCHNLAKDSCYIYVKDRTRPVPVADKGVTVSLSDKKVWVDASAFDEGSWDNCGVNFLLARRSDWYEACIDLCDDIDTCYVSEHHDTIWQATLEEDKHVDEVEAHYAKTLKWLCEDDTPCADILYGAWKYDLMKYATLHCREHPYDVTSQDFHKLVQEAYYYDEDFYYKINDCEERIDDMQVLTADLFAPDHIRKSNLLDIYSQIGGGWSDAVPFDCSDACGPVTVEILVMDYWCNWATAWTKVWVEDKTPVEVVKDVVDEEHITCKIYKEDRYAYPNEIHPVSLEYIVGQAKDGEQDAYDALDEIFGGYCKAWRDPYGNYVDSDGTEIDCDITFYDSICQCTSYYEQVRVFDEHLGYLWIDSLITKCDYYQDTLDFQKGVVVVNCEENVYCEQDVWCEIDHCGQGYIFRKFKLWQGCPDEFYDEHGVADSLRHTVDTIYRHQRIWVGNECELNKYMFDVPYDTEVVTCDIEYGPDGNVIGAAGPEYTGYATYKFDDDCRIVGIGHSDKVFKIVGGEAACYKILRTWYFADWCGYGEPLEGQWWFNRELVTDTCVQKIIVRDTTPPTCTIIGPVEDGGSIEVGACYFDLEASVVGMDACGVIKYYWDLKDITDPDNVILFDSDHGELSGDTTEGFDISSADLPHGSYKLVVTVQDDCANESYCEYLFDVVSVKKPSPVCISSLTARLTPWDSDQDGTPDSAHAIVWAEEFNSSSSEACTDTALEFRVELIDGIDDDTWEEDTSYIEVFCDDFGSHMARLWVISWPSGTVDFCDVVLIVQSDFSGCTNTVSGEPGPVSQVNDMHDVVGQPQRQGYGEPTQPGVGGRPLGQGIAPSGYLLEQNRPNPFRQETTIGFVLPEAMTATLTVYDVTGRVLRSIKGDYSKGYQTVQLLKQNLAGHAILYYRLDAKDFTATKKMILVN